MVLVIGYCTLPDIPPFYALVDLDEKLTKNLILLDDIRCNFSSTNQRRDAYVLDGRPHSNKYVSVNLYSVLVGELVTIGH